MTTVQTSVEEIKAVVVDKMKCQGRNSNTLQLSTSSLPENSHAMNQPPDFIAGCALETENCFNNVTVEKTRPLVLEKFQFANV